MLTDFTRKQTFALGVVLFRLILIRVIIHRIRPSPPIILSSGALAFIVAIAFILTVAIISVRAILVRVVILLWLVSTRARHERQCRRHRSVCASCNPSCRPVLLYDEQCLCSRAGPSLDTTWWWYGSKGGTNKR